jgi:hypothetical protein
MDELDQIIKQKQEEGFFSLEGISKETLKKEVRVEELMVHVNARIERSERYARFFSVSIFFVIYIIALYMQRTPSTAFQIENSFQRALLQSLPVGEEGAQFLSGEGDMYEWCDAVLLPPPAPPSCHSPDLVQPLHPCLSASISVASQTPSALVLSQAAGQAPVSDVHRSLVRRRHLRQGSRGGMLLPPLPSLASLTVHS